MFTQGTDFTCGPVRGNYVCHPKTTACYQAVVAMQTEAVKCLQLVPGVDIPIAISKTGAPDGDVGNGTNNLVVLLTVEIDGAQFAPVPAMLLEVARRGKHAEVTAYAAEFADFFRNVNANFFDFLTAYYKRIYGTFEKPAGVLAPFEQAGVQIAKKVNSANRRLFWLVVGGAVLVAGGAAVYVAYRKKHPSSRSRSRALRPAYA